MFVVLRVALKGASLAPRKRCFKPQKVQKLPNNSQKRTLRNALTESPLGSNGVSMTSLLSLCDALKVYLRPSDGQKVPFHRVFCFVFAVVDGGFGNDVL